MRYKIIFLALGLAFNFASAQQTAEQFRNRPTTTAAPAAVGSQQAGVTPSASINVVGAQVKPAPGVVMLSDVAKQTPQEPTKVGAIQATVTEVQPIQVLDANGKPLDPGTAKSAVASIQIGARQTITLTRISTVGAAKSAVLWVKGQQRAVTSGAKVLEYTVGEIREDGVCLYSGERKGNEKFKCKTFVTFIQGV